MSQRVSRIYLTIQDMSWENLRQLIVDHRISKKAVVYLHTRDYDDLVLDFRNIFKVPMRTDLRINGVRIREQRHGITRKSVIVASPTDGI